VKVLVLGFGDPARSASTVYRVAQYRAVLAAQGLELEFVPRQELGFGVLPKVAAADVVFNQKCVVNRFLGAAIRRRAKRLLFDFDDAMWTRPGDEGFSGLTKWRTQGRLRWWLRNADAVIAANHVLGDWAKPHARRLEVLPMALDVSAWQPRPRPARRDIVLGWAGSPVMMHLLEEVEPALAAALQQVPEMRLAIYCGKRPKLSVPFDHVPFTPGTEPAFVQNLDIGLLPMVDTEMDRGRSPIKSLQYLSCGVPVVGSFVGASREVLDASTSIAVQTPAQWTEAIVRLARDPALRQRLGAAGVERVRRDHSIDVVGGRLAGIIRGA